MTTGKSSHLPKHPFLHPRNRMRELGRTRRVHRQGRTVGATGWGLPVSGPGGGQVLAQGPGCLHHGHRRVQLSLHRCAPACSWMGVLPSRKALFGVLGLATTTAFPCCLSTAFSGAAPLFRVPREGESLVGVPGHTQPPSASRWHCLPWALCGCSQFLIILEARRFWKARPHRAKLLRITTL